MRARKLVTRGAWRAGPSTLKRERGRPASPEELKSPTYPFPAPCPARRISYIYTHLCLFRLFRMNVTHHSTHIGPLVLTTVPKCALSKEKTMFP